MCSFVLNLDEMPVRKNNLTFEKFIEKSIAIGTHNLFSKEI